MTSDIGKIAKIINENSSASDEYIFNSLNLAPGKSHEEVVSILKTIKNVKTMSASMREKLI